LAVDTLSRRALLEMKRDNDYAPRTKSWPPKGYVAPTAWEFSELLRMARRHHSGPLYRSHWDKVSDEQVLRRAQLCELAGPGLSRKDAGAVYDYARSLRKEMNRRKVVFVSLALLRCAGCSHSTERLFEATQATHPGMENRSGTRIDSAWFCARCWSNDDAEETEGEG
jgi:hypothetical protein